MSAAAILANIVALRATQPRRLPMGLLHYPGVRCPGCGGTHFNVGRVTAECVNCSCPLQLSHPQQETRL